MGFMRLFIAGLLPTSDDRQAQHIAMPRSGAAIQPAAFSPHEFTGPLCGFDATTTTTTTTTTTPYMTSGLNPSIVEPAAVVMEPGAHHDNMSHHSTQQPFFALLTEAEEGRPTPVIHSSEAMHAAASHEASMPNFKLVLCNSGGTRKISGADLADLTQYSTQAGHDTLDDNDVVAKDTGADAGSLDASSGLSEPSSSGDVDIMALDDPARGDAIMDDPDMDDPVMDGPVAADLTSFDSVVDSTAVSEAGQHSGDDSLAIAVSTRGEGGNDPVAASRAILFTAIQKRKRSVDEPLGDKEVGLVSKVTSCQYSLLFTWLNSSLLWLSSHCVLYIIRDTCQSVFGQYCLPSVRVRHGVNTYAGN